MISVFRRNALLKLNEISMSKGLRFEHISDWTKISSYKVALQFYGFEAVSPSVISMINDNNELTSSEVNALQWPPRGYPVDEPKGARDTRLQTQLLGLFIKHLHNINKVLNDDGHSGVLLTGFFDLYISGIKLGNASGISFDIHIYMTTVKDGGGYNLGFSSLNDILRKQIRPIAGLTSEYFGNCVLSTSRSTLSYEIMEGWHDPNRIILRINVPRRVVSTVVDV